ncbi:hypothetical protein, partial [Enterococcus mundtii]|uniref:hypothetical protein n=1 Tax=Enterococcus mundtii TaxID=53346 RepID=UPI001C0D0AC3
EQSYFNDRKGFLVEPFIPHPHSRWFSVSLALRAQLGLKTTIERAPKIGRIIFGALIFFIEVLFLRY